MEDLATARISVAQTAQRLIHEARSDDTEGRHTPALVKSILKEEYRDILARLGDDRDSKLQARYERSLGIALRWTRNYMELDFRSLGSYTRPELEQIGNGPDAF
jgi:malate synthase